MSYANLMFPNYYFYNAYSNYKHVLNKGKAGKGSI